MSTIHLNDPVAVLHGVGREKELELQQIGINTVQQLIEHFPYRYENHEIVPIHELEHEQKATITGTVQGEPLLRYFGRKKSRLTVRLVCDGILVTATFFNRAFLKNKIKQGEAVTLTGKWDKHRLTMTVQGFQEGEPDPSKSLAPVYSIGGNLSMFQLKKFIQTALKEYSSGITEVLPEEYLKKYKLPGKQSAYWSIHQPGSHEELKHARRRIVYEELLLFQLGMQALKRSKRMAAQGNKLSYDKSELKKFIQTIPFSLTGAQKRSVNEIVTDMLQPGRMNRLLQGDVGSGKTVVALIVMYAQYLGGNQSALMVPTEILAEQHFQSLQPFFENTGVKIGLLTGSVKGRKRQAVYEAIQTGGVDIVVGTHALIQEGVEFQRLGLVITDEQHRFGVNQRRTLQSKGEKPDVLFMTATPIPRTMAISVFGDMDVSVIDEMPAGRKPIQTFSAKHTMLERVLGFMKKELDQGRQGYVICPLIEESEMLDVQNAIDVHAQLSAYYTDYEVGLMHGRLSADEKEAVMASFAEGRVSVLVSTTVVEVGVNVPNASVMVIYDADRFGLAQLHQLRGRVGRGEDQSYCILLADPKSETGKERMRIMEDTNDGFVVSEKDLELRGPGDFLGSKQSGLPYFKLADVVLDYRALETARQDAQELINSSSFWEENEYSPLRDYLHRHGALRGEKLD